jgi:hypothetical protein
LFDEVNYSCTMGEAFPSNFGPGNCSFPAKKKSNLFTFHCPPPPTKNTDVQGRDKDKEKTVATAGR